MIFPSEEEHCSVRIVELLNVSSGTEMTSTPSTTTPSSGVIGSPDSLHVVIELAVGGLPNKQTKQVLVMAFANTFLFASTAVMLIVSSQFCKRAGRGGGEVNAAPPPHADGLYIHVSTGSKETPRIQYPFKAKYVHW